MSGYVELAATMRRIERVFLDAEGARSLPERAAATMSRVNIAPHHGYDQTRHGQALDAANRLAKLVKFELIAEAEAERDRILGECAATLESFRADLCNQAARAAIDLGAIARGLVP